MRILYIPKRLNCLDSLINDLFAYYKMNDTTNTIVDSISARNLINTGGSLQQLGILNYSVGFDATTSKYITGTTPLNEQTFPKITISLWIKFNNISTVQIIAESLETVLGTHGIWISFQSSDSKVYFGVTNSSGNNYSPHQTVVTTEQWYNLTLLFDSSGTYLKYFSYINGIANTVGWQTSALVSGTSFGGTLWFARRYYPIWALNGYIDDVKIWNRQLSDCEINANYNGGLGIEL